MTPGARQIYLFREYVIRKYGNLIRGWVLLLDRDKSGSVTRKEFMQALMEVRALQRCPANNARGGTHARHAARTPGTLL